MKPGDKVYLIYTIERGTIIRVNGDIATVEVPEYEAPHLREGKHNIRICSRDNMRIEQEQLTIF